MAHHVLTSGLHRRPVAALVSSRPELDPIPGPAVLFETDGDGSMGFDSGRAIAVRESGGDWEPVPVEVANQWERLTPELRARLVADPGASLTADEFRVVTNAGVQVTAVYWVVSEDSARFTVSGELRRFVRVISATAE